MSIDQFNASVEAIATQVWHKFGPEGFRSPAAYEEIKAQVQYSSWIVSDTHARKVLEYTKTRSTTRADAVGSMIHAVESRLDRLAIENEVLYWKVKFADIGRFLMAGEIDIIPTLEEKAFKEELAFCTEMKPQKNFARDILRQVCHCPKS